MSVKNPIWLSVKHKRFDLPPTRHVLSRFMLFILIWFPLIWFPLIHVPLATATAGDRLDERSSGHQVPGTFAENEKSVQSSTKPKDIEALIALLDSRDFARREQASSDLAALGESVIGPLAYRSFQCSPETGWRIKKTLESICTSGSESVFLKAIAILKLRFNFGSSDNPALAQSLTKLETQWRQKRKQEAIAKLREFGATINDPIGNAGAEFRQLPMWRGANLVVVNNRLIEIGNGEPIPVSVKTIDKRSAINKLSEKELREQIKQILKSDIDENRALVLGNAVDDRKSKLDDSNIRPEIAAQLAMRNQILVNQRLIGRPQQFNGAGVTVEIGEKWTGQPADYRFLNEVENLQQLSLVNQSISNNDLKTFAQMDALTKVVFDNCKVDADGIEDADWKTLNEVELRNQSITKSLIQSFASIQSLRTVTFNACKMKRSALEGFSKSKNLRVIQFNEIEIDNSIFRSLAKLNQVNFVNLTVCKFKTDDYKQLMSARPNLQIVFTAQAFFGVRGPINAGLDPRFQFDENGNPVAVDEKSPRLGVLITDVIDGSGAQLGGVKVGDIIEKVNEQSIEKFEDLRLHIAQHRAGDKLDVTVRRGKKSIKLQVELGSQKNAPKFEP